MADGLSLADLIDVLSFPRDRIAIELNHSVVRRAEWQKTELSPDDQVEIVHFVGGGVSA